MTNTDLIILACTVCKHSSEHYVMLTIHDVKIQMVVMIIIWKW